MNIIIIKLLSLYITVIINLTVRVYRLRYSPISTITCKNFEIDALKNNIREAIGEIQLHTIDNVLKNWTDRVGYCMAS